jgi:hypothetical protein
MPATLLMIFGPLLLRARPWLALLPGLASIRSGLRIATYVAVLIAGAWAGARALAWWQGDVMTSAEADARCLTRTEAARVAAKENALLERERALSVRAAMVEREAAELAALELELGVHREKTTDGDRVLIGGGDEWLRAWRTRSAGADGGRSRR